MITTNVAAAVPLLSIVALATAIDLRHRRIPNGLSLGGAAIGLLTNATLGGSAGFGLAVLGWSCCLIFFIPFYVGRGMAAGDVKLMAMVGAFLGPIDGVLACVCTLMTGAALASMVMVGRSVRQRFDRHIQPPPPPSGAIAGTPSLDAALGQIPYAAAIAIGALMVVLQPAWLSAAFDGLVR